VVKKNRVFIILVKYNIVTTFENVDMSNDK